MPSADPLIERSAVPHQHRPGAQYRRLRWDRHRWIAERTLGENMAVFEAAEITATPIYEIDQLLDDLHVHERGVLVEAPDDEAGSVLMHNVIPRLSGIPANSGRPPRRWASIQDPCCNRSAMTTHA